VGLEYSPKEIMQTLGFSDWKDLQSWNFVKSFVDLIQDLGILFSSICQLVNWLSFKFNFLGTEIKNYVDPPNDIS
jgi:hypothetical protein